MTKQRIAELRELATNVKGDRIDLHDGLAEALEAIEALQAEVAKRDLVVTKRFNKKRRGNCKQEIERVLGLAFLLFCAGLMLCFVTKGIKDYVKECGFDYSPTMGQQATFSKDHHTSDWDHVALSNIRKCLEDK